MKDLNKIESRDLYWKIISKIKKKPTCIDTWSKKCNFSFTDSQWKIFFILPFEIARDAHAIEFQIKIMHRFYASNSYVSNFDKTVNAMCPACNTKCDIVHMFFNCEIIREFWKQFFTWYNENVDFVDITVENIIFGILTPKHFTVNYCILYAKWYLHKEYKKTGKMPIKPDFTSFSKFLKSVLMLEKLILVKKQKLDFYQTMFSKVETSL